MNPARPSLRLLTLEAAPPPAAPTDWAAYHPPTWPPLLTGGRMSVGLWLRDAVLTCGMWLVLGYLLRDAVRFAVDWLRAPIGQFTYLVPPDWLALWQRLDGFMALAAVLALVLVLWSVRRRHRLQAQPTPRLDPPPLPLAAEAAVYGLPADTVQGWRQARRVTVDWVGLG